MRYFHVDAFAQTPFTGNPAGVCPLETALPARQISTRGGDLWCRLRGERVDISGYALTYAVGELLV